MMPSPSNRGSVYLVTLITITAIAAMVLIGIRLRTAENTKQSIVTQMAESNVTVLDATEYALQTVLDDPAWTSTAQSGNIFTPFSPFNLEDTIYSGTVTDADTAAKPTTDTTTYRLKLSAETNSVTSSAQIDLFADRVDYLTVVKDLGAKFYWPLNETSNPVSAIDEIGSNNGAYKKPSVAGGAINNEGAPVPVFNDSNDHVEVPWDWTFKQKNGSLSLWMMCTGATRASNYSFAGMDFTKNGDPTLNLSVFYYGILAYVDDDGSWGGENLATTSFDIINPGTWYHIAITWGSNGLRIYVDGVLQGFNVANTDGISTKFAMWGGEQPLRLGAGFFTGNMSTPEDGFEGSIAHVAFYDPVLTATEIADLAAIIPDLATYTLVDDSWVRVFE